MYKVKFTVLQLEILRFLFVRAGTSFNARGVAMPLKVSQTAVSKALPLLEKEGLINIEKDEQSGRWSIKLNRDNPKVIALKRAENLKMLYESGTISFLEDTLPGATILLFGSYSRGDDTVKSDIDIAIIGRKEKELGLAQFEAKLERKINLNFYASFNGIHKELKENLCNGIVLVGGIEL
ncbi:MAG: nucleotidyltransferase domain-containing protein [Nanoarchaeota archaeon]|nr:nucleotidyltransferase domain-containing protein [Nanoarchaeota archaeon]MBU4451625.1 nucleotidyltransferase domain-containing protein [Nanoarchaeota archaeon]